MERKTKLWKYLLFPAIGFAIGGALWGWECYQGSIGADETCINPFSFILGAVYLGFFGSLFLSFIGTRFLQIKKLLKLIVVGIVGCLVGFLVPAIFVEAMLIGGSIITPIFGIFEYIIPHYVLIGVLGLNPSMIIGQLWLEFLFTGLLITLFYALVLKTKLKPLVWRGGLGAALSAFVSPVCGNLIGNHLFHSLLSAYLINFTLIGLIFGFFLGWGLWKSENAKENI